MKIGCTLAPPTSSVTHASAAPDTNVYPSPQITCASTIGQNDGTAP